VVHVSNATRVPFQVLATDRCYTDYTTRDIVTYKRDYALEQVKFCEQALSEFDKEGKK